MTRPRPTPQFTPGPWKVVLSESSHRLNSAICKERCHEKGEKPIRIERIEPDIDRGWTETERHVMQSDWVEDIVATSGDHVVCLGGHDYGDYGYVELADAHLIAAAPDLYEALKACSFQLAQLVAAQGDFSDVNAKALDAARAALQRAEQGSTDPVSE